MAFSQSDIDAASIYEDLKNNPGGGNNEDYTEVCTLLESFTNPGEPLYWQSGDDETAAGFTKHKIGVTHPRGTNVAYTTASSTFAGYNVRTLPCLAEVLEIGAIPLRPCMENTFTFSEIAHEPTYVYFGPIFHDNNGNEKVFTISTDLQLRDNRHKIPAIVRGTDFAFKNSSAAASSYDIVYYIIYKPWDGRLTFMNNMHETYNFFSPRACAKLISLSIKRLNSPNNTSLTYMSHLVNASTVYSILNTSLILENGKTKDVAGLSTERNKINFKTNDLIGFNYSAAVTVEFHFLFDKHDR